MEQRRSRPPSPLCNELAEINANDDSISVQVIPRLSLESGDLSSDPTPLKGSVSALTPGLEMLIKQLNVKVDELVDATSPKSPKSIATVMNNLTNKMETLTNVSSPSSLRSTVNRLSSKYDMDSQNLQQILAKLHDIQRNQTDLFTMVKDMATELRDVRAANKQLKHQVKSQWRSLVDITMKALDYKETSDPKRKTKKSSHRSRPSSPRRSYD